MSDIVQTTKAATSIHSNMNVDSKHIVSLLVSRFEESLRKKEASLLQEISTCQKLQQTISKQIEECFVELEKDKQKEVDKFNIPSVLSKVSSEKYTVVVQVVRSITNPLNFNVFIKKQGGRNDSLTMVSMGKLPNKLKVLSDNLKKEGDNLIKLAEQVAQIKSYRLHEIDSLVRWAEGKIAEVVINRSGGEPSQIIDAMLKTMPDSTKKLLT